MMVPNRMIDHRWQVRVKKASDVKVEAMKIIDVPSVATVLTIKDWQAKVKEGKIKPEDGHGRLAYDAKHMLVPSDPWVRMLPPWATHVVWFGKPPAEFDDEIPF
jgi:hypothetical protein